MAQQEGESEITTVAPIGEVPEDVDTAVQETRHSLERSIFDGASPKLARGLVVMAVQQGKILDRLSELEEKVRSIRVAFNQNEIEAAELIERTETLSESIEALHTAAESYQDRMDSADQEYADAIRSDGGQQESLRPGQYAIDRDDDTETEVPSRMIVLDRPGVPANEYEIATGGKTIAEYNTDYPADDPTVVVVYENDALDGFGTGATPERLVENYSERVFEDRGVRTYTFPESRLQIAEDQSGIEPE